MTLNNDSVTTGDTTECTVCETDVCRSDYTDAANFQCLTSTVFVFCACFAPTTTIGGLMGAWLPLATRPFSVRLGRYTEGHIGMSEMLLAQCLCGVLWAVCSAQPLIITSATGPMLVFEAALYGVSRSGIRFVQCC